MHIAITGATGFLGQCLSDHFLHKFGNDVKLIALVSNKNKNYKYKDNPNTKVYYLDKTPIPTIFNNDKIDVVIHTATLYGRNKENVIDVERVNVEFPLVILSEAIKHNVKIFVNTSTILSKNINPYALTKSHFEDWLSLYADKIKCINLKLDHFYGPNDSPIKFIAWIIEQLKHNVSYIDLTEGSQIRDFIYIDDVVSAFDTIIKNEKQIPIGKLNTFEVGTNCKTSIKKMVITIKEKLGNTKTTLNFGAIPYRKNEVLDYIVDTSNLRLLGWKPKYPSIEQGIQKLLEIENWEKL